MSHHLYKVFFYKKQFIDPTTTKREGIIQEYEHQEERIMEASLKSVHYKTW